MVPESDPNSLGVLVPEDPVPTRDVVVVHLLFYATSVGMTVILMNLFIGVLGQNYEIYEDASVALFARQRARLIVELDNLSDLMCWLFTPVSKVPGCRARLAIVPENQLRRNRQPRLLIFKKATPSPDEERSLRTCLQREVAGLTGKIINLEAAHKRELNELQLALEGKLNDLRDALQAVLNKRDG